jgi:hypothetical protein
MVDADRPIARRGDRVRIGTLTLQTVPGSPPSTTLTLNLVGSPYDGSTPTAQSPIVLVVPGTCTIAGVPAALPVDVAIDGWIISGSPEIVLRRLTTEDIP